MTFLRSCLTLAGFLTLAFLCGCGAPRIDGSNEERARATVGRVRRSLQENRRPVFDRALAYVMSNGARALPLLRDAAVRSRIDRKNADEIIEAADGLRVEIERAEKNERTQRELRAVHDAFAAVAAADHPPNAAQPVFATEPRTATASGMPSAESPEALNSETPLTDDAQILRVCSRYPADNVFERRNCEQQEMIAHRKLLVAIPPSVDAGVASRLRVTCTRRAPDGYRERLACVDNILKMVPFVRKNPALLAKLPSEYRDDVAYVADIKP